MINVDFSFKDPHEIDFKSIRRLLTNYVPSSLISDHQTSKSLEESLFDASGMAECIVAQRVLGTMIKIDDDLDVYSFATILPVSRYRESSWMRSIKSFVLDHCKDIKKKKLLNDLFTGSSLGLMINERMLNVPAELSPVLVENLERDLRWVKNESALKEDRSIFSALTHILLLAPCWTDVTPKITSSASSSVISKSNFLHFEEQVFAKESVIDFEIKDISTTTSSSSSSSNKGTSSLRRPQSKRVIVMPLSVLTKCVTETKRLVEIAEKEEKELKQKKRV
jgi:protein BCP1